MAVPDTNTFSLQDVTTELNITINKTLIQCFASADAGQFDPLYEGAKDRLSNFRNYGNQGASCFAIRLSFSPFSSATACSNYNAASSPFYYLNNSDFLIASTLNDNSNCTGASTSGYYADGTSWKFWNGSSFTSSGTCTQ